MQKRTGKAKWVGVLTVGVGVAAMPKRLKCNGCGENLKRGGPAPDSGKAEEIQRELAARKAAKGMTTAEKIEAASAARRSKHT